MRNRHESGILQLGGMQTSEPMEACIAQALRPLPSEHRQVGKIWAVGLALAFIVGIVCGLNGIIVVNGSAVFLLACALFLELACRYFYTSHTPALTFVLVLLFMFAVGAERSGKIFVYNHQATPPPHKTTAIFVVTGAATPTAQSYSYPVRLCATLDSGRQTDYSIWGRILFSKKDSIGTTIVCGSQLLAEVDFRRDTGRNPNSFDFVAWQRRRGELFTGRVVLHSAKILGTDSTLLFRPSDVLRSRIIERFAKAGVHGDALELVKAMSIGVREELSGGVRTQFSRSGIAHLLALSGLHVGFVYAIFAFFSHLISSDRLFKRLVRELFPLLATWSFVLLAGASPSLLRAAIMLSVWGVSRIFFLRNHSIDVLSIAAILILWLSPASLYDLGFQLSFSALLGILLFYPSFSPYTHTRYKVITWCIQLLTLSLCAQLGTLPIILHTFGTLPLLSLFTNLLAIPLAALIVPIALLVGLLPVGSVVAHCGGFLLQLFANLLLGTAEQVATLPAVTLTGLRITTYMGWLLSGVLLFAGIFFTFRKRYAIMASLLLLGVFVGATFFETVRMQTTKEWVIYQQSHGTVLSFRDGRRIEGIYFQNRESATRHITQYAESVWGANVQIDSATTTAIISPTSYGFTTHTPLRIAIPLGNGAPSMQEKPITTDVLLLTYGCQWRIAELLAHFTPHEVVIDGSYPRRLLETARQEFATRGIRVHSTRSEGAWVYTQKR